MTDRSVTAGLPHIELIEPIGLRTKAALVVEIVITYARVRWLLWRHDLPFVVATLRGNDPLTTDLRRQAIGARLGHGIERTLRFIPFDSRCLARSLVLLGLLARPRHRLEARHRGRRRARILRARVGRERWPRAPAPPRRELPADRAMTEATRPTCSLRRRSAIQPG